MDSNHVPRVSKVKYLVFLTSQLFFINKTRHQISTVRYLDLLHAKKKTRQLSSRTSAASGSDTFLVKIWRHVMKPFRIFLLEARRSEKRGEKKLSSHLRREKKFRLRIERNRNFGGNPIEIKIDHNLWVASRWVGKNIAFKDRTEKNLCVQQANH